MNTGADAADQIVRMTLNGVEVAAKITGTGAKELAVLLYAVLKDQKKTKGKTRLTNMLKSGKELRVFAVKDKDLERFCREAKKYGVLYCVLKDKNSKDGLTDVMVRAEDASKINRIFERFKLSTVDIGQIQQELERASQQHTVTDLQDHTTEKGAAQLVEELLQPAPEPTAERDSANPTIVPAEKPDLSDPSSGTRKMQGHGLGDGDDPFRRPSLRQELNRIKAQQQAQKQRLQGRTRSHHRERPPRIKHKKER